MPIGLPPQRPVGKLSQAYFDALYRFNVRSMALGLLREQYRLSLHECQGTSPDVVRERQRLYDEHLGRLQEVWRKEDEQHVLEGS
mgnify:CR=1 FL=1